METTCRTESFLLSLQNANGRAGPGVHLVAPCGAGAPGSPSASLLLDAADWASPGTPFAGPAREAGPWDAGLILTS